MQNQLIFILFILLAIFLMLVVIQYLFRHSTSIDKAIDEAGRLAWPPDNKLQEDQQSSVHILQKNQQQQAAFVAINLKQNQQVFHFVIGMIIFGLILICIGLVRDYIASSPDNSNVSWAAIISGLVTQFIAATILVIFRAIFQQTTEYFRTAERMTSIEIALNLLEKLPDGGKKMDTQAEVAKIVLQHQLGSYSLEGSSKKDEGKEK